MHRRRGGHRARAAPTTGRTSAPPSTTRTPHHLYVKPDDDPAPRSTRARAIRLSSSISGDQPIEFRAQAADVAARSLQEAEPELEKLVRSGYRTVVAWPRRGEGERAAYNLARLQRALARGRHRRAPRPASSRFAAGRRCATASSPPACSSR